MSTNVLSARDIKRSWHLIDAQNQILGRLATKIASFLIGKNKANFVPYLEMGDEVVVVNAAKVKVSGNKEKQKRYIHHSGYPGGFKEQKLSELRLNKPEEIIKHAVFGMVPKSKLGRLAIKRLHVFPQEKHPFTDKFKEVKNG